MKAVAFACFAALLILFSGCVLQKQQPAPSTEVYHIHADFKVVLDGNTFDFNKDQYMSTSAHPLSERTHLHDFDPNVIHIHAKDVNLAEFFTSLGMSFSSTCFSDGNTNFCVDSNHNLLLYVNGEKNDSYGNYVPQDLDKIMIYYGTGEPDTNLLGSITNEACIYSEKCAAPPGFELPQESCSGGNICLD